MTTEEAKELVRYHFVEFVSRRNYDVVTKTLSDDFYDHDGPGGRPTNRDGQRLMMVAMHRQVPDLDVQIEDILAEGDKVVCRNIWRGTTSAGHRIKFKTIVIWRVRDGKIVERWASTEQF